MLKVLYTFWRPTPSFTMWQTASGSDLLHVVLAAIQVLCWVFIACSLFFTDYLELIGLKQVCVCVLVSWYMHIQLCVCHVEQYFN